MQFADMGSIKELIKAGGPVLFLLVFLSVYSISVMIDKYFKYRNNINKSRKLMNYILRNQLPVKNYNKIMEACRMKGYAATPVSKLVLALLKSEKTDTTHLNDTADAIISWETAQLSRKLSVLATLASTTPFIGLFGTVLGVMRAFADLSSISGTAAGPSVVAKGISEALVNTAAGLFVAVPALVAYNYFLSKLNFFTQDMQYLAQEIISAKAVEEQPLPKSTQSTMFQTADDLIASGKL